MRAQRRWSNGGQLARLAPSFDAPAGHTFDRPAPRHCVYYGRDRGEMGTEVWVTADRNALAALQKDRGCKYNYVLGKTWTCNGKALTKALLRVDA